MVNILFDTIQLDTSFGEKLSCDDRTVIDMETSFNARLWIFPEVPVSGEVVDMFSTCLSSAFVKGSSVLPNLGRCINHERKRY